MKISERIRELVDEKAKLELRLASVNEELRDLLDDVPDATSKPLTDRQREVLAVIEASISAQGFPPSVREIGDRMGIRSNNGVIGFLRALEQKGWISRIPGHVRSIRVLRSARMV